MIVTRLMGGLGNQMFQYAAGRALALRRGTELKIDREWLSSQEGQSVASPRTYELGCFNIEENFASLTELGGLYSKRRFKLIGRHLPLKHLRETPKHSFDPAVLEAPDNTYLDGFWQSERFFKDFERQIRHDFTFKTPPRGKNAELAKLISGCNAISIHVRRGDYVADKNTSKFHGTASLPYYQKAIGLIAKEVDQPHFFVFSDEIDWTKKNFEIGFPATYVDHNPPTRGFEDMRLMSLCDHHILANSSFSWWGAWLGQNREKKVIGPRKWYNDPTVDTTDLLPEGWIRL
jgi:hypothetical protein